MLHSHGKNQKNSEVGRRTRTEPYSKQALKNKTDTMLGRVSFVVARVTQLQLFRERSFQFRLITDTDLSLLIYFPSSTDIFDMVLYVIIKEGIDFSANYGYFKYSI